ncbi:MAG: DUF3108 domain-containing protein [Proteobacteria bacterium]|nr:DUF3108 domain-containing protein [Pseudomonadota bacterium]
MSFRTAAAALALCCTAPAALAQTTRQIQAGYEITFVGMTGFRIDFTAKYAGNRYDIESHVFKEGILKALTIQYEGRNRAWGTFGPQGMQPSSGSLALVVGGQPRTWLAQYGQAGLVSQTFNPQWKPTPKQAIPEDKVLPSLDPLSAAISVGAAGDAACDRTVPSNDGKRRIDIILKKIGTESPQAANVAQAKGDLLICDIYTKRVAGEFYDAPAEAETDSQRPMRIWLARMDETQLRYPVKLEAKTFFGIIHGRMLYFRDTVQ